MSKKANTVHHAVRFPPGLFYLHQEYLINECLTAHENEPLINQRFFDVYFEVNDGCNVNETIDQLLDRLDSVANKSGIQVKHINHQSCFKIDMEGNGKYSFPF